MTRILKYTLPRDGHGVALKLNVRQWLDVRAQDGVPCIWAIVDDEGPQSEYEIIAWGTGWEFPDELDSWTYMGTAIDGDNYVWHYFMRQATVYACDNTTINCIDYSLSNLLMNSEKSLVTTEIDGITITPSITTMTDEHVCVNNSGTSMSNASIDFCNALRGSGIGIGRNTITSTYTI